MSNFRLINAPDKTPGVDYLTRSSVGPFIDTGRDAPAASGRGLDRIYISVSTLRHMADLAGITAAPTEEGINAAYRRGLTDGIESATGRGLVDLVADLDRVRDLLHDLADSESKHQAV
jgi:hypothetical protein